MQLAYFTLIRGIAGLENRELTMKVTDLKADSSKRARRTIAFSLNLLKDDESYAHQIAGWWKSKRKMATYIHRAIILFYELQQGNVERFAEEFPNVHDGIRADAVEEYKQHIASEQFEKMIQQMDQLKQQIASMQQQPTSAAPAARQHSAPSGDSGVEVKAAKSNQKNVTASFLSSMTNGLFD
jgi:hypothetical protein